MHLIVGILIVLSSLCPPTLTTYAGIPKANKKKDTLIEIP